MQQTFNSLFSSIFTERWSEKALADYGTQRYYSYGEFAQKIAEVHAIFDSCNIQKGDKVAVLGKNSSHWTVTFFAAVTYGAVIVPILDEFNPKDIINILNHSDSKLLFCDSWFVPKVQIEQTEELIAIFSLEDFALETSKHIQELKSSIEERRSAFHQKYSSGYTAADINYHNSNPNDVIVLNYTSGTTSLTKGVMLMDKNITGNITFGVSQLGELLRSSLAVLPIAHVYGLLVGVLMGLGKGGQVTFLGKIPSPSVLLSACAEVKPTLLVFVPLIFEKIYRNKIKPTLDKPIINFLTKLPIIRGIIYRKICKSLYEQLGGDGLSQVIIGGAAINPEVEQFFRKIKFPFTVGYGMTECAPLISYVYHDKFVLESVGIPLGSPRIKVRIAKENPTDQIGEVQVRGQHVMKGYYKNEEATINTFTEDGWLKTGDLGYIDRAGNLFLKGRSKTMLLGPSGENIYPEAIESKIMNLPFVAECIVLQNKANKLVAFVYPDYPMLEQAGVELDKIDRVMANNRRTVNDELARFENISRIEIVDTPFAKTPKNTVKRYGLEYLLDLHEQSVHKKLQKSREENKQQNLIRAKEAKAAKMAKSKSSKKTKN